MKKYFLTCFAAFSLAAIAVSANYSSTAVPASAHVNFVADTVPRTNTHNNNKTHSNSSHMKDSSNSSTNMNNSSNSNMNQTQVSDSSNNGGMNTTDSTRN